MVGRLNSNISHRPVVEILVAGTLVGGLLGGVLRSQGFAVFFDR